MTGTVLASTEWWPLVLTPLALAGWAALFWLAYRLEKHFGRRHRQPPG